MLAQAGTRLHDVARSFVRPPRPTTGLPEVVVGRCACVHEIGSKLPLCPLLLHAFTPPHTHACAHCCAKDAAHLPAKWPRPGSPAYCSARALRTFLSALSCTCPCSGRSATKLRRHDVVAFARSPPNMDMMTNWALCARYVRSMCEGTCSFAPIVCIDRKSVV